MDPVVGGLMAALVFLASFMQSLSGFGFAILVMPLATLLLGLHTAAPAVALIALTVYVVNLIRYRRAIDLGEVLRLALASVLGIPIGVWAFAHVDESLIQQILGAVMVGYGAYALLQPRLASPLSPNWVYPAGFLAGCLSGAYNTPGPPVILYGSLRQWPKDDFRAVLQALFLVNAVLVVASHLLAGHLTSQVLILYLWAAPALLLGILVGSKVDLRVDQVRFRTLILAMILVVGVLLLVGLG